MKIVDFLKVNFIEFKEVLVKELDDNAWVVEDLNVEDLGIGCYLDNNYEPIESDKVCSFGEGIDLSFDSKYVDDLGEGGDFEIVVNGKTVHGLWLP